MDAKQSIIRRSDLEAKVGLSCSTIYNRLDKKSKTYDPDFPKPIKLGKGKNPPVGWLLSEVDGWIEAQIQFSRKVA